MFELYERLKITLRISRICRKEDYEESLSTFVVKRKILKYLVGILFLKFFSCHFEKTVFFICIFLKIGIVSTDSSCSTQFSPFKYIG